MIIALLACILLVLLIGPEAFVLLLGKLLKVGFMLAAFAVGLIVLLAIVAAVIPG